MPQFVKTSAIGLFSLAWFQNNAWKIFKGVKEVLSFLKIDIKDLNPGVFVTKFMNTLVTDEKFQSLVFSVLISKKDENGEYFLKDANGKPLEITPEQMFKDVNYYFETKGTPVAGRPTATLAEGAYESIFRDIDKVQKLPPPTSLNNVMADLKKISSQPNFKDKSPKEKRDIFVDFAKRLAGENQELLKIIEDTFKVNVK